MFDLLIILFIKIIGSFLIKRTEAYNKFSKKKFTFKGKNITLILVVVLLVLSLLSLFIGVIGLDLKSILSGDLEQVEILLISRLPRLLAIICTGVGMSVAGLIMQHSKKLLVEIRDSP